MPSARASSATASCTAATPRAQPELNIGDEVLVYVLQPESPEGHAVLSLRRAGLERKWRAMQEQLDAGVIIEAPVIDHNKGGLIVDCGIRGFVPISQIVDFPRRPQNEQPRDAAQEIAEKLQPFVGRKLRLKILEVNRKANRLILSEKVALYEERREKRDELFSSLQVGQKVTGTVRSIAPFGVFVDLGGIDGLVHKSELSWNKVNNPEAGYQVGEEVEAEVIDINHERGRISLSIRRLQPDPWHSTVADFKVGDVIDGTVTKLVNFGAFVRVERRPRGPDPHQRAVAPARRPSGRRRPRGPDAQAQDHLARLGAPSPGPQPEAGRGAAGPTGAEPGATVARRARERRAATGARLSTRAQAAGARGRHRQHAGRRVRPGPASSREPRRRVRERMPRSVEAGGDRRGCRRRRAAEAEAAAAERPKTPSRGSRRDGRAAGRSKPRRRPRPPNEAEAADAEGRAAAEEAADGRARSRSRGAAAEAAEPEAEEPSRPRPSGSCDAAEAGWTKPRPRPRPRPTEGRGAEAADGPRPRRTRRTAEAGAEAGRRADERGRRPADAPPSAMETAGSCDLVARVRSDPAATADPTRDQQFHRSYRRTP